MSLPKETQPKRCPDKYLWLSVLLDRLMGWFPLLGRFGPMIAFSKAQTIFSRLLALCLFGMALMGVVRRQDGRFRFDANIRKRWRPSYFCRRWLSKVSEPVDWPPLSMVCWAWRSEWRHRSRAPCQRRTCCSCVSLLLLGCWQTSCSHRNPCSGNFNFRYCFRHQISGCPPSPSSSGSWYWARLQAAAIKSASDGQNW